MSVSDFLDGGKAAALHSNVYGRNVHHSTVYGKKFFAFVTRFSLK